MLNTIGWQTALALGTRGLAFVGFEIVNPGPKQRIVAKAAKANVRVEVMGHTFGDAEDKLMRLVRAN